MIIPLAHRADQTQEYYFSVKLAEVRRLQAAGHDVINLGIGNPDLMPSSNTIDALIKSVQQPTAHGYQPYKGTPRFARPSLRFTAIPTALRSTLIRKFCHSLAPKKALLTSRSPF